MIDSHTHLYVEEFDEDRAEVFQRAIDQGITDFLIPAIDSQYEGRMKSLKSMAPNQIHLMTGLHPTHVKANYKEELAWVASQLKTGMYCAVGEIGMDLYWDQSFRKEQQMAFAQQIQWSIDYQLPIAIHCRDAFDAVFTILNDFDCSQIKGIFHCFTGTFSDAQKAMQCNLLLGIGGVVTFKNGKIDQFLSEIPLEHIVLETDAPYLAPVPHRGKRNESAYLSLIAEKVAQLYQLPLSEVVNQTTANIQRVFSLERKVS